MTQPPNVDPDKAEAGAKQDTADSDMGLKESKPEPPVVGLGIAAGARRPGAKKAAAPKPAAAPEPAEAPEAADVPETAAAPEPAEAEAAPAAPSSNGSGDDARVVGDEPPVKGLGIAKGARRPGKR
ncbi:Fe-S oxidoreductase [Mycolicibacterium neoaurum]|uniref:Fe-S oxidoreductase n=1 Tax=Mycolicibacterium neoaurum TaxID=1795 RepID=A0AAV2WGN8_MYCNE|nr:Fe-S oxidoreductase [Mycolicibacterium neoaurum]